MYYTSDEEMPGFIQMLKLRGCPFCKLFCLILHGFLRGYSETDVNTKIKRGQRMFCNDRKSSKGCGRTFTVYYVDVIKKFVIKAGSIWTLLRNIGKEMNKKKAFEALNLPFSIFNVYNLWNKFKKKQVELRTIILVKGNPPDTPGIDNPAIQTIKHLEDIFPGTGCAVSEFQKTFQKSFF